MWNDPRLQFKQKLGGAGRTFPSLVSPIDFDPDKIKYLTLTDVGKVWQPDTFFRNEKIGKFHDILAPNLYVRIHPNGDVLYSIRFVMSSLS